MINQWLAIFFYFASEPKFGTIQLTGIYGSPADNFPIDLIFNRDITVTSGQAPVIHLMPKLYEMIKDEVFDPTEIITHTFPLEEADEAYKVFDQKKDNNIKVVFKPEQTIKTFVLNY